MDENEAITEPEKKVILAIDDVVINLRTIKTLLEDTFDVRLAKSGEIALEFLSVATFDLILVDIEMPGMSGFDFVKALSNVPNAKGVPIIFVTAHATNDLVVAAAKIGVKNYIIKPIEPEILRTQVYSALHMPMDVPETVDNSTEKSAADKNSFRSQLYALHEKNRK